MLILKELCKSLGSSLFLYLLGKSMNLFFFLNSDERQSCEEPKFRIVEESETYTRIGSAYKILKQKFSLTLGILILKIFIAEQRNGIFS